MDVTVNGTPYRFVSTHLETRDPSPSLPYWQAATLYPYGVGLYDTWVLRPGNVAGPPQVSGTAR